MLQYRSELTGLYRRRKLHVVPVEFHSRISHRTLLPPLHAWILLLLEMLSSTNQSIDDEIDDDAGCADVPCSGEDAEYSFSVS